MDDELDSASIPNLLSIAFTRIQDIELARQHIGGTSSMLESVQMQQNRLAQSLVLLVNEPQLCTPYVAEQMRVIINVQSELKDLLRKLQSEQGGGSVKRFLHVLNSGDQEDQHLAQILGRLHKARQNLMLREVGLISNDARFSDDPEAHLSPSQGPAASRDNLDWQRNKTQGEPSLWVGNVGFETSDQKSVPRANVKDNEFGEGLRFVVGHVGPHGASSFMDNFFRR